MNKNILIIDDDKEIVELLAVYLRNEGYNIYKAYDGDEALQKVSTYEVDLMILDIMMPKRNGLEVCQEVRENNTVPILMLSAKAEDMDKILGLMTGADDYTIAIQSIRISSKSESFITKIIFPKRYFAKE